MSLCLFSSPFFRIERVKVSGKNGENGHFFKLGVGGVAEQKRTKKLKHK